MIRHFRIYINDPILFLFKQTMYQKLIDIKYTYL